LTGAKLRGASLKSADLSSAVLHDANLFGADLEGALLDGTSFRGADLREACLRAVNFGKSHPSILFEAKSLEGALMPDGLIYDPAIHQAGSPPVALEVLGE
jgi:uncharacterized protein YjbI with pentapeptide repeats